MDTDSRGWPVLRDLGMQGPECIEAPRDQFANFPKIFRCLIRVHRHSSAVQLLSWAQLGPRINTPQRPGSDLDLHAKLDDSVDRQVKELRRPLRVA